MLQKLYFFYKINIMETNNTRVKNYVYMSVILGISSAIIAGFWYVSSYAKSVAPNRTFSISAEGKVTAVPDIAQVLFGVLTEGGKNIGGLQAENSQKANRAISYLKKNGVLEKDIKTESYNISPRYNHYACPPPKNREEGVSCPPSEIVGYSISQSISVKIRDLNKAGDLLGGVVENGANTVSGLSFTVDDPDVPQDKARKDAITRAKKKAQLLAEAGGFRLGKVISIQEGQIYNPYNNRFELYRGKGGDFASPEVEPGSQEIKLNVTITYEIR